MDNHTVVREVTKDVWTFSQPFYRISLFGFRRFLKFGMRATAIVLNERKELLVILPVELDDQVKQSLHSLGEVKYIACDLFHYLNVDHYKKEWPNATFIGVPGLEKKKKDINWGFLYSSNADRPEVKYKFDDVIETRVFPGTVSYIVAFLHKPSKTMIQSDLLFNLPCNEQFSRTKTTPLAWTGPLSRAVNKRMNPYSKLHQYLLQHGLAKDKKQTAADANYISQNWDFDRIIPSHGDVMEQGGKKAWNHLFGPFIQKASL